MFHSKSNHFNFSYLPFVTILPMSLTVTDLHTKWSKRKFRNMNTIKRLAKFLLVTIHTTCHKTPLVNYAVWTDYERKYSEMMELMNWRVETCFCNIIVNIPRTKFEPTTRRQIFYEVQTIDWTTFSFTTSLLEIVNGTIASHSIIYSLETRWLVNMKTFFSM